MTVLDIKGYTLDYATPAGIVRALESIDLAIERGEVLGLVGESGSGKSLTALALLHLLPAGLAVSGQVSFDGAALEHMDEAQLQRLRGAGIGLVFQEPLSALDPLMNIGEQIAESLRVHRRLPRREVVQGVIGMLGRVGLTAQGVGAERYPHEISGGQRQRVNIARALALSPRLVILDEAVSALDKSVEAQVLNLLADLKREFGLTYLFISHDLNVVRYISDRVLVMYLGEVVELGPVDKVWDAPAHPYTRALLAAMPSADPDNRTETPPIAGDPPNPIDPPSGCRFHTRCPFAEPLCASATPKLAAVDARGHEAACHMTVPGSGHSRAQASGTAA